jgi:hypothetical protein
MRLRYLFLCSMLFLCMPTRAQESSHTRSLFVAVRPQAGFFWTHRYNMGHLVKKQLLAGEADIWTNTTGNAFWHQPFHFPQMGLSGIVMPLGNPEQLGTAIAVYPFINFPLGEKSRRIKMHFRLGWGLGWLTKKFDPETNHKNIAIGSHLNTIFSLRLNAQMKLNAANNLDAGIGIIHFSNGGARVPNLGINLPMVSLGYSFRLRETGADFGVSTVKTGSDSLFNERRWRVGVLLVTGFNGIEPARDARYGLLNVLTSVMRQTARKHRFGGGVDLMWSQAVRYRLRLDGTPVSTLGAVQAGVKFSYELVIGRLSCAMETGVYVFTPYTKSGLIYNRIGARYLLGNHFLLATNIKTHLSKAEYWEVGAGWRF